MARNIVTEYKIAETERQALRVSPIKYPGNRVPLKTARHCLSRDMVKALDTDSNNTIGLDKILVMLCHHNVTTH